MPSIHSIAGRGYTNISSSEHDTIAIPKMTASEMQSRLALLSRTPYIAIMKQVWTSTTTGSAPGWAAAIVPIKTPDKTHVILWINGSE
jgi:hypothetical protein